MKVGLYAGSFDPFTKGHMSIIQEASELFDYVYVAIAHNSSKTRFTNEIVMKDIIEKIMDSYNIKNVKITLCNELVADYCNKNNINYLIRGLRNTSDYLYEENIAKLNLELNPNLKTIYLRAQNETISSSMIRELRQYNKDISKYVHPLMKQYLEDIK